MYPHLDRISKILERLSPALGAKFESKNVLTKPTSALQYSSKLIYRLQIHA